MISIVIPTYNEKKNILPIFHNFKKIDYNFEVIFVDDNSNDGTIQSIRSLINDQKKKNIKLLLRKNKVRDLSCSIVEAVVLAKFKYILVIDADLQHDFSNINLLIQNIVNSNYDVVTEGLNYCAPLTIGAKASSAFDRWIGKADDLAVYNRALSASEVASLYVLDGECASISTTNLLNDSTFSNSSTPKISVASGVFLFPVLLSSINSGIKT
jgi:glycosyltransferase involved in cell wall biosynthesis